MQNLFHTHLVAGPAIADQASLSLPRLIALLETAVVRLETSVALAGVAFEPPVELTERIRRGLPGRRRDPLLRTCLEFRVGNTAGLVGFNAGSRRYRLVWTPMTWDDL